MSDLLQSQIKDSCKLALPNGLKELMSDISREVLRAQPSNVYDFITKYLAALLVTRENLSVGCRLCRDICEPNCHPELEDELRNIGLDKDDAITAKEVILRHFEKGKADEKTLMIKLLRKTNITEEQLESVQGAIRDAFLQHQLNKIDDTEREMPPEVDEMSLAANHTMQLYSETGPSEHDYDQKAQRIQAAYRAYGVRRFCKSKTSKEKKKNIRFDGHDDDETSAVPNAPGTDMSKSSSVLYYDPKKFKDTDETSSQTDLSETYKPNKTQPHIHHEKNSNESLFRDIITKESVNINKPDDITSVNEEKEHRSTFYSVEENLLEKPENNLDPPNENKVSIISEVRFSEPVVLEHIPAEESKADDVGEELAQVDLDKIDFDVALIVDDHAVEADDESDATIEDRTVDSRNSIF